MRFSIVTVALNDLKKLQITLNSVLSQKYQDFEYVVVDGCSSDGTIEYVSSLVLNNSKIKFISEKDNGIYDAMNKGVKMSSGDYLVFLQAGDTLFSSDTLRYIDRIIRKNDADLVYGLCVFSGGKEKGKVLGNKMTEFNAMFGGTAAHQSVFAKRQLLIDHPFNITYKVAADQEFVSYTYKVGYKLCFINRVLAYTDPGYSATSYGIYRGAIERMRILKNYFPLAYTLRQLGHFFLTREFYHL